MSNESTICASEKVSEQPGLNTGASCQTMHGGHYARHKKKQHLAQQTRTKVGEFPELRRDRTSNADVQIQNKWFWKRNDERKKKKKTWWMGNEEELDDEQDRKCVYVDVKGSSAVVKARAAMSTSVSTYLATTCFQILWGSCPWIGCRKDQENLWDDTIENPIQGKGRQTGTAVRKGRNTTQNDKQILCVHH